MARRCQLGVPLRRCWNAVSRPMAAYVCPKRSRAILALALCDLESSNRPLRLTARFGYTGGSQCALQRATPSGGMAERFNAVVLKITGRKARGFESLSLRPDSLNITRVKVWLDNNLPF